MIKKKISGAGKAASSVIPSERIAQAIYAVRNEKVMVDADLATLYCVTTGNLVKAVKRNIERFPEDFMFQLTPEEYEGLLFQTGRSKRRGGRRTPPYAFTEYGVAMLSSVLRSKRAVMVNIEIMRAFGRIRKVLASNRRLAQEMDELSRKVDMHDKEITVLFAEIQELAAIPEKKGKIGFKTPKKK